MSDSHPQFSARAPSQGDRRSALPLLLASLLGAGVCFTLANERLRGLLINSAWLTLGTLAISLPLGTFMAVAISKTSILGRQTIKRLMIALLLVPLFVQATAWQAALGQAGWLWPSVNSSFALSGLYGAIFVHGISAIGWVVLFVGAALHSVPRELEEEALQDSPGWRVLARVSLPAALAGVAAAALWIAAICLGEITITDLFQVRTFAEEVYTTTSLGSLDFGFFPPDNGITLSTTSHHLAAYDLWLGTALVLILVSTALATIWSRLPTIDVISPNEGWVWQLGRGRWLLTLAAWILTAGIVGLPLASLAEKAGLQTERVVERPVRTWSPMKAARMVVLSPWEHRREARWSFTIGGLAAGAATVVGVLIAWALRTRWLPPRFTAIVLGIGFAIPGPLLGMWVIRLLNQPEDAAFSFLSWWYNDTILAPVVVQFLRAVPLVTLVLTAQFASVPQDVLDSATTEGAGGWRQLLGIGLPLAWPAVLAAACMALIVAIGDMAATLLVLPPGVATLSTRISGLLHFGAEDRVSALCLALVLGLGGMAAAAWQLPRMFKSKSR